MYKIHEYEINNPYVYVYSFMFKINTSHINLSRITFLEYRLQYIVFFLICSK
jgi:hypothetical protein